MPIRQSKHQTAVSPYIPARTKSTTGSQTLAEDWLHVRVAEAICVLASRSATADWQPHQYLRAAWRRKCSLGHHQKKAQGSAICSPKSEAETHGGLDGLPTGRPMTTRANPIEDWRQTSPVQRRPPRADHSIQHTAVACKENVHMPTLDSVDPIAAPAAGP